MASRLNPYLNFRNTAREAMEFYKSVFGGELVINTFKDFGAAQNPAEEDLVMHAQLEAPNDFWLMGSDTPSNMEFKPGTTMTVSLSGDDQEALTGFWNRLSEGATISQPLTQAPWGDSFGMLTDRFGTPWMVNISGRQPQ